MTAMLPSSYQNPDHHPRFFTISGPVDSSPSKNRAGRDRRFQSMSTPIFRSIVPSHDV
jgi:hypothetical protein